ncbi:MAG: glycosyltransferase family 4 protein [Roseiflexaceae bacterium]|nr:glycosyltransferase family 4 protein [Roseiflexaceae bacterium]
MRIALYNLTTTTKVGGVESFVWDLARELARRGHAVTIFGGVGAVREHVPGVRVLLFPALPRTFWRTLPLLRRAYAETKLLERLSMAIAALPELVRGGYDIVHIQKPYDLAPTLLARTLGGPRVLLGCHGEDFYRGDRWLARQADGAVSCSAFNAQTIAARYGFTPRVVFNGVDTQLFQQVPADPSIRPAGIPAAAPLLLFVGRLQPWKGVEYAIRALAAIPRAALLIAGEGVDRPRLMALAHELGLSERVRFLGQVPRAQLPRYFSSVDLLVATSFASETFGIGLVEAQACGLPVVATRFGGFPEVVNDGATGLLVPPQDSSALAIAITTLLADPVRRQAMSSAAPAWAAQFSWQRVADRVEQSYDEMTR